VEQALTQALRGCSPSDIRALARRDRDEADWEISCTEGGGLIVSAAEPNEDLITVRDCAEVLDTALQCRTITPPAVKTLVSRMIASARLDCQATSANFEGYELASGRMYFSVRCASGGAYLVSGSRQGADGQWMRITGDPAA
jgi:hypothetical protein